MFLFGSGVLYGTPTVDANGAAIVNPTPIRFGTLQDVSVDISFDTKALYGQNQFPVAVGRGKGKIGCKAKIASLNGATLNSLFFGQTLGSSIIGVVNDVTGIAIPTTPFTITATTTNTATTIQIPSAGTWTVDLGVIDANGVPMTRVASGPVTGQYTVAAGVYVFAAADVGKIVFINYEYTATSTTSKTSTVNNLLMGAAPSFRVDLSVPYNGKQLVLTLFNCVASKLALATKQDDFIVPEFDFDAFANSANQVLTYSLSE